jgi:hypothetical protein
LFGGAVGGINRTHFSDVVATVESEFDVILVEGGELPPSRRQIETRVG